MTEFDFQNHIIHINTKHNIQDNMGRMRLQVIMLLCLAKVYSFRGDMVITPPKMAQFGCFFKQTYDMYSHYPIWYYINEPQKTYKINTEKVLGFERIDFKEDDKFMYWYEDRVKHVLTMTRGKSYFDIVEFINNQKVFTTYTRGEMEGGDVYWRDVDMKLLVD